MRPMKPAVGMPCNGCGLCCRLEICALGRMAYPDAIEPCPGLRRSGDMFRCALVEMESSVGAAPVFAESLGIGRGCDSSDTEYSSRKCCTGEALP